MPYTDNCDVFGSFHEDGFNAIIQHIQHQRPSLFNYATADLVNRYEEFCKEISFHEAVSRFGNPIVSSTPYLPIPGYNGSAGISYCFQLAELKIDFHPENSLSLPSELQPLGEQKLSLMAKICVGLGCPDKEYIDRISQAEQPKPSDEKRPPQSPTTGIPAKKLTCFCLEVYGVLSITRVGEQLHITLDGLEIVDIRPEGLENVLECYVATVIRLSLLPKLRFNLSDLVFKITDIINLGPTPISLAVPFNPAIEEDEIKIMMNLIP